MTDAPLREALRKTLEGLRPQIVEMGPIGRSAAGKTSDENLHWMIEHCLTNLDTLPTDKISRWIGFVQGALAARGQLDVDAERDRTRPFFHEAYAAMGMVIPETAER